MITIVTIIWDLFSRLTPLCCGQATLWWSLKPTSVLGVIRPTERSNMALTLLPWAEGCLCLLVGIGSSVWMRQGKHKATYKDLLERVALLWISLERNVIKKPRPLAKPFSN